MSTSTGTRRLRLPGGWVDYVIYGSSIVCFFGLWELASGRAISARLLPGPLLVFSTAGEMTGTGELLGHIAVSGARALVGFVVGCLAGAFIGLLIGRIRFFRQFLDPLIILLRPIPPVALIPLSIIWFGIGEGSRYYIIIWATLWAMIFNTAAGVSATPPIRIRAAQCMGASRLEIFWEIILPSAVPYILTGMRIGVGSAFSGLVAAEMIAAQSGLGYLIMLSRVYLQTEQMFVGLLALGIFCAACDHLFRWLSDRTMRRYMQYLYYA